MKSVLFVFLLSVLLSFVIADEYKKYGICSCFKPAYDGDCCMRVHGTMEKGSNVCRVPTIGKPVQVYEECCKEIKGRSKCKTGYTPIDNQ
ncbi:hypothetical protein BJ944DRAFT_200996 [Cunninghamella echinulata]|nr:hypothetical protein BJ944DRAFT_200996 [Cunninghamella echinulata]